MPPKRKRAKHDHQQSLNEETSSETSLQQQQTSSISDENDNNSNKMLKFDLKIISWNVNGIRAALKNGIMNFLNSESCDILALQETKCNDKTFPNELKKWDKFPYKYYVSSKQDGYAGVALFSKQEPLSVEYGIGNEEYDDEGRIITAFYENFILVNAYVVNAGQGLKRLDFKIQFDKDFREYLLRLNEQKPVILCGDLNCAHKEIDLENPKTNLKTAGFTVEERKDFDQLLDSGFIDTFRFLYPDKRKAYTYWGYRFNCRAKDIGWRLDYFLISKNLQPNLIDNQIYKHIMGSDHCPIVLYMNNLK